MPRWLTKLVKEPRVRKAAVVAGKAAAGTVTAGAGLALGLRETKRAVGAWEPLDLWQQASFELGPRPTAAPAAPSAAVARLAAIGGFTVADFQAAARRLRPVELELEEFLEQFPDVASSKAASSSRDRAAAESAMVQRWKERGYFDAKDARTGSFGRRLTSDAQGVDIGSQVPAYLLPEDGAPTVRPPAWAPGCREAAAGALQRWGCVLLRGAVAAEDVAELREALGLGTGMAARRAGEVGRWLLQKDPSVAMGRYTFGRLHCLLRGSPDFEPRAVAAHAAVAPLMHAFFRDAEAQGSRVFLSEAQLIVADPIADAQSWHLDAAAGGPALSVFLPLAAVPQDRGPQELLPGSHALHERGLSVRERCRRCLSALCATHGAVSSAASTPSGSPRDWAAGDALVLDGRLLHRALANDSLGAPIPMLVLRYDLVEAPPPGCSRRWLRFMTHLGGTLDQLFRFYSVV
uniref:Uncharacterized protein n=1 Tax=Alexandrium catenella TaxID=2925 RepID=A0A7S1MK30_ALECA